MKSKKLNMLAGGLLLVSATALASCGPSKGYTGDVDPTIDTRGVEIEFWSGFGSTITDQLEDLVLKNFSDKYQINVKHTSKGGYSGLQKAINLSASSVTYPNIAIGYPDHFASYIDSDIQLRLDSFIQSDAGIPESRTDEDGTVFQEAAKIDMSDFYESYMTENRTLEYDDDGNPYTLGLPFNKSTEVLVYNKTFFENDWVKAAGIILPETWDEVETQGKKIIDLVTPHFGKVLGADGKDYDSLAKAKQAGTTLLMDLSTAKADNFYPLGYDSSANLFITGLRQWGATYTTIDQVTRHGYIGFDSGDSYTIATQFLIYMQKLANEHILALPTSFEGTALYCSSYFTNFQSVMNVGSSAGLSHYSEGSFTSANGIYAGVSHIPYKTADKKYVISQGTNLCMLDKGSEAEREASWKAVKYLATEGNGLFASLTGYYPVCKSAANSEIYQTFLTATTDKDGNPLSDNDLNMQKAAKYNTESYDADGSGWVKYTDPGFNGSSSIREDVGNLISEIIVGKTAVKDTLDKYIAGLGDYRK